MDLAALIQPQIKQQIEFLYQAFLRLHNAEQITLIILAVSIGKIKRYFS